MSCPPHEHVSLTNVLMGAPVGTFPVYFGACKAFLPFGTILDRTSASFSSMFGNVEAFSETEKPSRLDVFFFYVAHTSRTLKPIRLNRNPPFISFFVPLLFLLQCQNALCVNLSFPQTTCKYGSGCQG